MSLTIPPSSSYGDAYSITGPSDVPDGDAAGWAGVFQCRSFTTQGDTTDVPSTGAGVVQAPQSNLDPGTVVEPVWLAGPTHTGAIVYAGYSNDSSVPGADVLGLQSAARPNAVTGSPRTIADAATVSAQAALDNGEFSLLDFFGGSATRWNRG